jgi:hypothetical protein
MISGRNESEAFHAARKARRQDAIANGISGGSNTLCGIYVALCELHLWRTPLDIAAKKLETASVTDRGAEEKLSAVRKAVFEMDRKGDGKETSVRQVGNPGRRVGRPQQAGKLRWPLGAQNG